MPYAKFADQVGTTDCPLGYAKKGDAGPAGSVLCTKGKHEVVKAGRGATAFWIDRHEASVWQKVDGTGTRYFENGDNAMKSPRFHHGDTETRSFS